MLLRNLLDNAIKYSPAQGQVDVGLHQQGGQGGTASLVVEDNGPGIPEAERARVLDRFYRVPDAPARGSGLGLAIVKTIADQHGATLLLGASERLGGLRVELRFPVSP